MGLTIALLNKLMQPPPILIKKGEKEKFYKNKNQKQKVL